jgi:hypothetical protein
MGKRHIGGHFHPGWARVLNSISAEEDRSIESLLAESLNLLFRSRGKPVLLEGGSPAECVGAAGSLIPAKSIFEDRNLEQRVLGALMIDNRWIGKLGKFLKPEHFADEFHARIFDACVLLYHLGEIVDPLTLKNHLGLSGADAGYIVKLVTVAAPHANLLDEVLRLDDLCLRETMIHEMAAITVRFGEFDGHGSGADILSASIARLRNLEQQYSKRLSLLSK